MRIDLVTAIPGLVSSPLEYSILKRARQSGVVEIYIQDLREFTHDKHHQVDDYPFGGGAGMIMKPEPFFRCVDHLRDTVPTDKRKIVYMTPQGITFNQKIANELVDWEHIIILCGHYKGVDERVIEGLVDEEISIGDYILSGGEIPALVVVDAVVRLIPGAISDMESAKSDSFQQELLDCPYYTRPEEYRGMRVPEILLSGNHKKIEEWRKQKSFEKTKKRRKDLLQMNIESLSTERMEGKTDG